MTGLRQTAHLVNLFGAQERGKFQGLLFNGFALPALMAYLGERTITGVESLRAWLAGSIVLALGMNGIAQAGYTALVDRFANRLALLRSAPVPKEAYYAALVVVAILESLIIVVAGLVLFGAAGVATLTVAGSAAGVLGAVAAGAALAGIGAAIAFRVRDFDTGNAAISIAALGLALVSPVLYSVDALPAPLRLVAWLSPFTYLTPLLHAALAGAPPPAWAVAGCLIQSIVVNVACLRWLPWTAE